MTSVRALPVEDAGASCAPVLPFNSSSESIQVLLAQTRSAMATAVESAGNPVALQSFRSLRRTLASQVAQLPPGEKGRPDVRELSAFLAELLRSGLQDFPLEPNEQAFVAALDHRRWPELLAGMLVTAAWRWEEGPTLSETPDWLASEVATWTWNAPQGILAVGDAAHYTRFAERRLHELALWAERNRGSTIVRAALEAFLRGSSLPLYFTDLNLRPLAELRGRVLRQAFRVAAPYSSLPYPRAGRRLRVGFVNRHFGPQTETYTTLPTFEHLNRAQFEVLLFALHEAGTPLEDYCRSRASEFHLLSGTLEEQVAALRQANLDVVVFGTNLTANANEVTRLATQRVAPLQVVNNSSPITSGLPEIDLYVSGQMTETANAAAHYSERLGLLPGPAHAFNYEVDHLPPVVEFSRAQFQLPEAAPVFVTAANYFKIIPELQHAWARLLAATPGSSLLVHPFNSNWSSSYPVDRFESQFRSVLAEHGLPAERLKVSREQLPSRSDVKALLALGDVYLDSFPFSGVNSLVDPLEAGVPVAVWEGQSFRSRMAASLLRALGLDELVAADEPSYRALATRLATDAGFRAEIKNRVAAVMQAAPPFLDRLAASDGFGALILEAFDDVAASGAEAFRRERTPLRCQSHSGPTAIEQQLENYDLGGAVDTARQQLGERPTDGTVRRLLARALSRAGETGEAVTYAVAALAGQENDASAWYEAALALRSNQQNQEAIEALESSLRLDPSRIDAWSMIADLAHAAGAADMAADAESVIRELNASR